MSYFTDYVQGQYVYTRGGIEYSIDSGMLNSLFKSHGYYADPGDRSGNILSNESLERLRGLAKTNNDMVLSGTIASLTKGKAPSPRMTNDGITHETTLSEKHRYDHLGADSKAHILAMLKVILEIGLYLGGWKGSTEPYITALRTNYDVVRMELKVSPLIQGLYSNPHYALVKNFPIVRYHQGLSSTINLAKPSIIDASLNVDRCLNGILFGLSDNPQTTASHLIATAYYYITTVCNLSLPMVEPLIGSLAQVQ
jgi:hypothetical protein